MDEIDIFNRDLENRFKSVEGKTLLLLRAQMALLGVLVNNPDPSIRAASKHAMKILGGEGA